jgi:hypothetical protein
MGEFTVTMGNKVFSAAVKNDVVPIDTTTVPSSGIFWQAAHDWQTEIWNYKPRSEVIPYRRNADPSLRSLPEMVPMKGPSTGEFVDLTPELQQLWYDLLVHFSNGAHSKDEMDQIWRDVTAQARALTDNHSREFGCADYILGENLGGMPMAIKYLTSGGNLLKQTRRNGTHIYVEAINTNQTLLTLGQLLDKPWLIQWATESTVFPVIAKKTWVVSRWHWNFAGGIKYGTPFPLLSQNGELMIERSRVVPAENGKVISPYYPETA